METLLLLDLSPSMTWKSSYGRAPYELASPSAIDDDEDRPPNNVAQLLKWLCRNAAGLEKQTAESTVTVIGCNALEPVYCFGRDLSLEEIDAYRLDAWIHSTIIASASAAQLPLSHIETTSLERMYNVAFRLLSAFAPSTTRRIRQVVLLTGGTGEIDVRAARTMSRASITVHICRMKTHRRSPMGRTPDDDRLQIAAFQSNRGTFIPYPPKVGVPSVLTSNQHHHHHHHHGRRTAVLEAVVRVQSLAHLYHARLKEGFRTLGGASGSLSTSFSAILDLSPDSHLEYVAALVSSGVTPAGPLLRVRTNLWLCESHHHHHHPSVVSPPSPLLLETVLTVVEDDKICVHIAGNPRRVAERLFLDPVQREKWFEVSEFETFEAGDSTLEMMRRLERRVEEINDPIISGSRTSRDASQSEDVPFMCVTSESLVARCGTCDNNRIEINVRRVYVGKLLISSFDSPATSPRAVIPPSVRIGRFITGALFDPSFTDFFHEVTQVYDESDIVAGSLFEGLVRYWETNRGEQFSRVYFAPSVSSAIFVALPPTPPAITFEITKGSRDGLLKTQVRVERVAPSRNDEGRRTAEEIVLDNNRFVALLGAFDKLRPESIPVLLEVAARARASVPPSPFNAEVRESQTQSLRLVADVERDGVFAFKRGNRPLHNLPTPSVRRAPPSSSQFTSLSSSSSTNPSEPGLPLTLPSAREANPLVVAVKLCESGEAEVYCLSRADVFRQSPLSDLSSSDSPHGPALALVLDSLTRGRAVYVARAVHAALLKGEVDVREEDAALAESGCRLAAVVEVDAGALEGDLSAVAPIFEGLARDEVLKPVRALPRLFFSSKHFLRLSWIAFHRRPRTPLSSPSNLPHLQSSPRSTSTDIDVTTTNNNNVEKSPGGHGEDEEELVEEHAYLGPPPSSSPLPSFGHPAAYTLRVQVLGFDGASAGTDHDERVSRLERRLRHYVALKALWRLGDRAELPTRGAGLLKLMQDLDGERWVTRFSVPLEFVGGLGGGEERENPGVESLLVELQHNLGLRRGDDGVLYRARWLVVTHHSLLGGTGSSTLDVWCFGPEEMAGAQTTRRAVGEAIHRVNQRYLLTIAYRSRIAPRSLVGGKYECEVRRVVRFALGSFMDGEVALAWLARRALFHSHLERGDENSSAFSSSSSSISASQQSHAPQYYIYRDESYRIVYFELVVCRGSFTSSSPGGGAITVSSSSSSSLSASAMVAPSSSITTWLEMRVRAVTSDFNVDELAKLIRGQLTVLATETFARLTARGASVALTPADADLLGIDFKEGTHGFVVGEEKEDEDGDGGGVKGGERYSPPASPEDAMRAFRYLETRGVLEESGFLRLSCYYSRDSLNADFYFACVTTTVAASPQLGTNPVVVGEGPSAITPGTGVTSVGGTHRRRLSKTFNTSDVSGGTATPILVGDFERVRKGVETLQMFEQRRAGVGGTPSTLASSRRATTMHVPPTSSSTFSTNSKEATPPRPLSSLMTLSPMGQLVASSSSSSASFNAASALMGIGTSQTTLVGRVTPEGKVELWAPGNDAVGLSSGLVESVRRRVVELVRCGMRRIRFEAALSSTPPPSPVAVIRKARENFARDEVARRVVRLEGLVPRAFAGAVFAEACVALRRRWGERSSQYHQQQQQGAAPPPPPPAPRRGSKLGEATTTTTRDEGRPPPPASSEEDENEPRRGVAFAAFLCRSLGPLPGGPPLSPTRAVFLGDEEENEREGRSFLEGEMEDRDVQLERINLVSLVDALVSRDVVFSPTLFGTSGGLRVAAAAHFYCQGTLAEDPPPPPTGARQTSLTRPMVVRRPPGSFRTITLSLARDGLELVAHDFSRWEIDRIVETDLAGAIEWVRGGLAAFSNAAVNTLACLSDPRPPSFALATAGGRAISRGERETSPSTTGAAFATNDISGGSEEDEPEAFSSSSSSSSVIPPLVPGPRVRSDSSVISPPPQRRGSYSMRSTSDQPGSTPYNPTMGRRGSKLSTVSVSGYRTPTGAVPNPGGAGSTTTYYYARPDSSAAVPVAPSIAPLPNTPSRLALLRALWPGARSLFSFRAALSVCPFPLTVTSPGSTIPDGVLTLNTLFTRVFGAIRGWETKDLAPPAPPTTTTIAHGRSTSPRVHLRKPSTGGGETASLLSPSSSSSSSSSLWWWWWKANSSSSRRRAAAARDGIEGGEEEEEGRGTLAHNSMHDITNADAIFAASERSPVVLVVARIVGPSEIAVDGFVIDARGAGASSSSASSSSLSGENYTRLGYFGSGEEEEEGEGSGGRDENARERDGEDEEDAVTREARRREARVARRKAMRRARLTLTLRRVHECVPGVRESLVGMQVAKVYETLEAFRAGGGRRTPTSLSPLVAVRAAIELGRTGHYDPVEGTVAVSFTMSAPLEPGISVETNVEDWNKHLLETTPGMRRCVSGGWDPNVMTGTVTAGPSASTSSSSASLGGGNSNATGGGGGSSSNSVGNRIESLVGGDGVDRITILTLLRADDLLQMEVCLISRKKFRRPEESSAISSKRDSLTSATSTVSSSSSSSSSAERPPVSSSSDEDDGKYARDGHGVEGARVWFSDLEAARKEAEIWAARAVERACVYVWWTSFIRRAAEGTARLEELVTRALAVVVPLPPLDSRLATLLSRSSGRWDSSFLGCLVENRREFWYAWSADRSQVMLSPFSLCETMVLWARVKVEEEGEPALEVVMKSSKVGASEIAGIQFFLDLCLKAVARFVFLEASKMTWTTQERGGGGNVTNDE